MVVLVEVQSECIYGRLCGRFVRKFLERADHDVLATDGAIDLNFSPSELPDLSFSALREFKTALLIACAPHSFSCFEATRVAENESSPAPITCRARVPVEFCYG